MQTAKRFASKVHVASPRGDGDGKSILSVLQLGVESGSTLDLTCEGQDEEQAIGVLAELVESGLGEGVVLYRSVVTAVGSGVAGALAGGRLEFFAEAAPVELQPTSALHRPAARPCGRLHPGVQIRVGTWTTTVTGVGGEADRGLAEAGHLLLKLGGGMADLPEQVAVQGSPGTVPAPGDDFWIVEPERDGAGA